MTNLNLPLSDTEIEVLYCALNNEIAKRAQTGEWNGGDYNTLLDIHKKVFSMLPVTSDYKSDPELVYIYGPSEYH